MNDKILITGSSGFVGGRIVEKMYFKNQCTARCLIRSPWKQARIARFNLDIIVGDIISPEIVEKAAKGCRYIIHCAFGSSENLQYNKDVDSLGVKNICESAIKNRIEKIVYISTAAIYGDNPPAIISEDYVSDKLTSDYSQNKLLAEKIFLEYQAKGINIFILRPDIVSGPFSNNWVIAPFIKIRAGNFKLIKEANGVCNYIYVDDLVDASLKCIESSNSMGGVYNVLSQAVTWDEYFNSLAELVHLSPLKKESLAKIKINNIIVDIVRKALGNLRKKHENKLQNIYKNLEFKNKTKTIEGLIRGGISWKDIPFYSKKAILNDAKIRNDLGFIPTFNLNKGMNIIHEWLKFSGYAD